MLNKLERYLDKKGLELNAKKSKITRFRKRDGKIILKKLEMERKKKVKEFAYLRYENTTEK